MKSFSLPISFTAEKLEFQNGGHCMADRTKANFVTGRLAAADCSEPDIFFIIIAKGWYWVLYLLSGEQIPKLLGKFPSGIFITIYGFAMASEQQ